MFSILYGIRASVGQGTSPTIDSYLDKKKNLSKIAPSSTALEAASLPQKSEAKELLIKLAWLTKMGVMKTWKVQVVRPYDALFVFL